MATKLLSRPICWFCRTGTPTWYYPQNDWLLCETCAPLLEYAATTKAALLDRYGVGAGSGLQVAANTVVSRHLSFQASWGNRRVPYQPEDTKTWSLEAAGRVGALPPLIEAWQHVKRLCSEDPERCTFADLVALLAVTNLRIAPQGATWITGRGHIPNLQRTLRGILALSGDQQCPPNVLESMTSGVMVRVEAQRVTPFNSPGLTSEARRSGPGVALLDLGSLVSEVREILRLDDDERLWLDR